MAQRAAALWSAVVAGSGAGAKVGGGSSTSGDASALSKLNSWRLLKLIKIKSARSRLYRSQILQVNTRWKALAEIYTMHSFAPLWNPQSKNGEKRTWPKQPRKEEKTRKREANKRSTASHLELQRKGLQEKIARENKE